MPHRRFSSKCCVIGDKFPASSFLKLEDGVFFPENEGAEGMDLKKQRMEMAVTGLMLGLASYLQYIAYHTKARTNVQGMQSMTFPKIIL